MRPFLEAGRRGWVGRGRGLTLDVVLQDFGEDREERLLEAADCGGIGLAGDADGQTQRLKQVVVEVRLAGILKKGAELVIFLL